MNIETILARAVDERATDMWMIPHEDAGDTGKKFMAVKVYPTPMIGMRKNP